jgi:hypothetical protein
MYRKFGEEGVGDILCISFMVNVLLEGTQLDPGLQRMSEKR